MKKYNYDLAKEIIDKLDGLGVLESASLGMHEDWFWTAQRVWEDGKYVYDLMTNKDADKMHSIYVKKRDEGLSLFSDEAKEHTKHLFGGIYGSTWASPVLQVDLKDGTEKTFNCFIGSQSPEDILKGSSYAMMGMGVLSTPVSQSRKSIHVEDYKEDL